MLTQTTETAIQCLIYLARNPEGTRITPQKISDILKTSTSYTSKILRLLTKVDILVSHRGAQGGFSLNKNPEDITVFDVYEACQKTGSANYCDSKLPGGIKKTCGYHQAMFDITHTFHTALKRWNIQQIAKCPSPSLKVSPNCKSRWTHKL